MASTPRKPKLTANQEAALRDLADNGRWAKVTDNRAAVNLRVALTTKYLAAWVATPDGYQFAITDEGRAAIGR
jgi:hypothetical protein